ncbi:MAG: cytidine deaminase [Planctomycetota bacterium]
MTNIDLVRLAAVGRRQAYAPYSGFRVGAAVQTADGVQFSACNVENGSYGLTICAERAAACAAVAAGHKDIVAIAVVAPGGPPPCGACRQFLAEFGSSMTVLMADADNLEAFRQSTLDHLLPDRFQFGA